MSQCQLQYALTTINTLLTSVTVLVEKSLQCIINIISAVNNINYLTRKSSYRIFLLQNWQESWPTCDYKTNAP